MPSGCRLTKDQRLRKASDFLLVQTDPKRLYSKNFLLLVKKSSRLSRLGLTVSKKVDRRAVVRNKIKRRLREIFRRERSKFIENFDIIVIARQNAGDCSYLEIKRQIIGALHHGGIL